MRTEISLWETLREFGMSRVVQQYVCPQPAGVMDLYYLTVFGTLAWGTGMLRRRAVQVRKSGLEIR